MSDQPDPAASPPEATYWQRLRTIRDRPSGLEAIGAGVLGVLALLLVWHVLTMGAPNDRILSRAKLPSISETFSTFPSLWFDRALARSALASLGRVFGGFVLAAAISLPLGVLAGCYLRLDAFLQPLSVFGRNIPIAALVPLSLIWFGTDETQKVMFIVIAAIAFILFDTTTRIRGVSDRFLDTAYTLGAKPNLRHGALWALIPAVVYGLVAALTLSWLRDGETLATAMASRSFWTLGTLGFVVGYALWLPILGHQVIAKVLLPLAMPHIVNSLRLLFGLAFGYIMLAEVINAKAGLGYLINMSQRVGPREHIYLCLIIIALLAFAIDRAALWLQHRLFPYARHAES